MATVAAWGVPPEGGVGSAPADAERAFVKRIDWRNPKEVLRIKQRRAWQRQQLLAETSGRGGGAELASFKQSGTDRVLVILAEFGGTDTFTWTPGVSTWDPLGQAELGDFDGVNVGNRAASTFFAQHHGITGPTNFTYHGPLHNAIPRPLGANDVSAVSVWVPDFNPGHYEAMVFGDGIGFNYTRQDGSVVDEDFTGMSVRDYYGDLSDGAYKITGTILGWVQVPHSVWWYGADQLPGTRSGSLAADDNGSIPGASDTRGFVRDALAAARAAYPELDWASYDGDGDGEIDRLWIIHAGLGEEDHPTLLNRTDYGESALWSHSWALGTPYQVAPGVAANAYILMPENAGLAVLSHEFGHNLGAMDLYTYGEGQTSAGFWTLMADSWVGYPVGFLPQGMDPMHLDDWGWLEPLVISDPSCVYTAHLGQASRFPGAAAEWNVTNLVRGVRIELPENCVPLAVRPQGQAQWWGGKELLAEAQMTQREPVRIPEGGATLEFLAAYDTEAEHDLFLIEVSVDGGRSWDRLATWSGVSPGFPSYQPHSFPLTPYIGQDLHVRFRYTTDQSLQGSGPFVDEVVIRSGDTTLFAHNAEGTTNPWTYQWPWRRVENTGSFTHRYYLQWRNTGASGGYDRALGDPRFRFGPVDSGLLVWYQDDRYYENTIGAHLADSPAFGPKGRLLVVDAHPEPYTDPSWIAQGMIGERANVFSRALMRDAAFSRHAGAGFSVDPPFVFERATFAGRPAIHWFSDALGYYPGIQELAQGQWRTVQWDAGVVLPALAQYPVRGAGYPLGAALDRVVATRATFGNAELLTYRTNRVEGGIRLPGGTGSPGAVDAQYGWNVWIVRQTESAAEIVIWNSRHDSSDADGDRFADWEEAIAGTDPNDPESSLRVTRLEADGEAGVRLEWTSTSDRVYGVWRAGPSEMGFGELIARDLPATPPQNTFLDPLPPPGGPVFYRIEVQ